MVSLKFGVLRKTAVYLEPTDTSTRCGRGCQHEGASNHNRSNIGDEAKKFISWNFNESSFKIKVEISLHTVTVVLD